MIQAGFFGLFSPSGLFHYNEFWPWNITAPRNSRVINKR